VVRPKNESPVRRNVDREVAGPLPSEFMAPGRRRRRHIVETGPLPTTLGEVLIVWPDPHRPAIGLYRGNPQKAQMPAAPVRVVVDGIQRQRRSPEEIHRPSLSSSINPYPTIQHIIQSKLPERAPHLFNLLLGHAALGSNLHSHRHTQTGTGRKFRKHTSIKIHPFLRRHFSAPAKGAKAADGGFGFGRRLSGRGHGRSRLCRARRPRRTTTLDDRGYRNYRLRLCITIGERGLPRDNESNVCPGADAVSFRLTNLIRYMRQWNSSLPSRGNVRDDRIRCECSHLKNPRVTLPPPPYRAAHAIESRAISNQLHGDKWIAADYAVSTFDILTSVSFGGTSPICPTRNTELKRFQWLTRLSRLSFPSINPKKGKTGAQRARAYRQRKRQKAKAVASPNHESPSSESLIPEDFSSADSAFAEPPFTPPPTVTLRAVEPDEDAPSRSISRILLVAAAITLAAVGIAMNGWFARSLGSSDAAGWLFLAIGVAADLVALVAPSCAARLWQARHRATSLAGWAVWAMTFVFAASALVAGGAVCLACGAGRRLIMGGDTRFIRNEKPAKVAIDVVRWLCRWRHRRHYVSFLTMSGNSEAPADLIGNVGSSRAQVLPITQHSFGRIQESNWRSVACRDTGAYSIDFRK
jgi:hypothetical protein